jgi:hypothetical protein
VETLHAKLTYEKHLQDKITWWRKQAGLFFGCLFPNNNDNNENNNNNPQDYNDSSSHEGTVTGDEMSIQTNRVPAMKETMTMKKTKSLWKKITFLCRSSLRALQSSQQSVHFLIATTMGQSANVHPHHHHHSNINSNIPGTHTHSTSSSHHHHHSSTHNNNNNNNNMFAGINPSIGEETKTLLLLLLFLILIRRSNNSRGKEPDTIMSSKYYKR